MLPAVRVRNWRRLGNELSFRPSDLPGLDGLYSGRPV
jgi:hypothetical protein